jgi:hypothetical protein
MHKEIVKHGVTTYSALPYPLAADYQDTLKDLGNECNALRVKFESTSLPEDEKAYRKSQLSLDKFTTLWRAAFGVRVSRALFPIVGERND